jgi:DNA-binding transcriptional ArsR family regulator
MIPHNHWDIIMSFIFQDIALHTAGVVGVQKLVLIAIASFTNKHGESWPSVATIASLIGISTRTVSRHIALLLKKGYLVRIYRKGRSALTRISTKVWDMLALGQTSDSLSDPPMTDCQIEPVIGINQITAPSQIDSVTATADVVIFETVIPDSRTAAVLTLPATTETVQTVNPFAGVEPQLLADFGVVRKAKKKPAQITRTEALIFANEAQKAGMTVAQAMFECVTRGWSRFQAEWLPPKPLEQATRLFVPEMMQLATPEIKAAGMAAWSALRTQFIPSAIDPLRWARDAIAKDAAGERVGHALLRNARMALRI